jgi:hypothetical protein
MCYRLNSVVLQEILRQHGVDQSSQLVPKHLFNNSAMKMGCNAGSGGTHLLHNRPHTGGQRLPLHIQNVNKIVVWIFPTTFHSTNRRNLAIAIIGPSMGFRPNHKKVTYK